MIAFQPTPAFRARRRRTLVRVRIEGHDGLREVLVEDVSSRGLRATGSGPAPAAASLVTVHLPDGTQHVGLVRWSRGTAFGVEFDVSGASTVEADELPPG